ncbi:MAG: pepsin/retropepsin-like aspartic protease family protein [Rhizomicrobium sp.]
MHFDNYGRPVVPVSIESRDESMVVDTGGIYSMVTDAAAKELDLRIDQVDPGTFYTVQTGQTISTKAIAHDFAVGRIKLTRPQFLVLRADRVDETIAGILAPDVMRRFDVEFDFAGGKFNVFSQDHCAGRVVYWAADYAVLPFKMNDVLRDEGAQEEGFHIVVDATLDGKIVRVLVDTGSDVSYMTIKVAHDLFGLDEAALTRLDKGKDESEAIYTYPFKALDLQGVSVQNPKIVVEPDKLGDPDAPELTVGMTVLKKLHLYIAYGEKKLYVTGADASVQ